MTSDIKTETPKTTAFQNLATQEIYFNILNSLATAAIPVAKTVFQFPTEAVQISNNLVSHYIYGKENVYHRTFTSLDDSLPPLEYCATKLISRFGMAGESLVFTRLSSSYLGEHYKQFGINSFPLLAVGNAALEMSLAAFEYHMCIWAANDYKEELGGVNDTLHDEL